MYFLHCTFPELSDYFENTHINLIIAWYLHPSLFQDTIIVWVPPDGDLPVLEMGF